MREHLDSADVMASILMLRTTYSGSILVVEGAHDVLFFTAFVNQNACQSIAAFGKSNVVTIIGEAHRAGLRGVIGVVDADYWHLDGMTPAQAGLVATDFHDIESMIIASPALDKLERELCDRDRLREFLGRGGFPKLRGALYSAVTQLGILKWISQTDGWHFNFDGITVATYMRPGERLDVDIGAVLETVACTVPRLAERAKTKMARIQRDGVDPREVCVGHDLVNALTYGIRATFGKSSYREISDSQVSAMLRMAYDSRHFLKTRLYQSIRQWEEANAPYVIFSKAAA
jgi:Protein of unknown function (DUF4435)